MKLKHASFEGKLLLLVTLVSTVSVTLTTGLLWWFNGQTSQALEPNNPTSVMLDNLVQQYLWIYIGILVLSIIASSSLVLLIRKIFTPPYHKIIETVKTITQNKDYSLRVDDCSKNKDYQQLISSFNHMLEKIQENQQELVIEKKNAEKANILKSNIISNTSHELRTPMHAILCLSNIGNKRLDKLDPERVAEMFADIHNSADRLMVFINNLIDLSILEMDDMPYKFKETDIHRIAKDTVEQLQNQANEKNITIDVEEPNFSTKMECDREKIQQVLDNIISNAIKFSFIDTSITIKLDKPSNINDVKSSKPEKECIEIAIADQGVGIPPEEQDTIFETFTQSSKTRSAAGGRGLGLAICNKIVKDHQGQITIKDNNNQGSIFYIKLPCRQLE